MATGERAVVTLSPPAADKAKALGDRLDLKLPETIRKALSLLKLWADIQDMEGAYMVVRLPNGDLERIVLLD